MTTVAVLADPPRPGLVLPDLAGSTPLSESETADLYRAMLRDVCRAVERSGGDLLVNYRADDDLPEAHRGGDDADATDDPAEAAVRAAVEGVVSPETRFEVQVGSTRSARVGNTVTHLLEREGVATAAVVEPTAPFLARAHVDNAAMKLRRSDVVLGPADGGRVHYAGFGAPVDFEDAFDPPALSTLTERGRAAGHGVDFLPMLPVVETRDDLVTAITHVEARRRADRIHPEHLAAAFDDLGLSVRGGDEGPELVRE